MSPLISVFLVVVVALPDFRVNGNWRGGFYSQQSQAERRRLRDLIRRMRVRLVAHAASG